METLQADLPARIKAVYNSCSKEEQSVLRTILQELAATGHSTTYEQVWLADYKEIPVDKYTFLTNPYYLGGTNNNGAAIYPAWMDVMLELERTGNQYNEIVFTGATRTGKTSTAVADACYQLYRLMCLRDPQAYFGLKSTTNISIFFFNLTQTLAKSVAFKEFNTTISECKWFLDHGHMSASEANPTYIPEGGKIEVTYGSDASHAIGKATYCLTGDTVIICNDGAHTLESVASSEIQCLQYDDRIKQFILVPATIACTGYTDEIVEIELENGSILRGTPEHKVMLTDGSYKCLKDLTSSDDLITFNMCEVDDMNLSNSKQYTFSVYIHTSPKGKKYIGITCSKPQSRWGRDGKGYADNTHFYSAIQKYGWSNFTHEVVAEGLSLKAASDLESKLIADYDTMNPEHGYNHTTGGNWSHPSDEVRARLTQIKKQQWKNLEFRRKIVEGNRKSQVGKTMPLEVRGRISKKLKGRPSPMAGRQWTEEQKQAIKGRTPWNAGLTKDQNSSVAKMSQTLTGRQFSQSTLDAMSSSRKRKFQQGYSPVWINNGVVETTYDSACEEIPEGFTVGRLDRNFRFIFKNNKCRYVPESELPEYLNNGWLLGRGPSIGDSIRKSNQKYRYVVDGIPFDTAQGATDYLRTHGCPNIVSSTVTELCRVGFKKSSKYYMLKDRLVREDVIHENKIDNT